MTSVQPAPAPSHDTPPSRHEAFELDSAWQLHPAVSVRPEPFGALLYHFGNRRLSFLKTRQLLEIVQTLNSVPTARDACLQAGVTTSELPGVTQALASLAAGEAICRRPDTDTEMSA